MPQFYAYKIAGKPYVATPFFAAAVNALPILTNILPFLGFADTPLQYSAQFEDNLYTFRFDPVAERMELNTAVFQNRFVSIMTPIVGRDIIEIGSLIQYHEALLSPGGHSLADVSLRPAYLEPIMFQEIPHGQLVKEQGKGAYIKIEANTFLPRHGSADDLSPLSF
ncbi:MAG: hypothetical protein CL949_13695 [Erythrobacter sp.]|nr:hypothetical protein [Erythrobacter sp.]